MSGSLSTLARAILLAYRTARGPLLISLGLGVIRGAFPVLAVVVTQEIVTAAGHARPVLAIEWALVEGALMIARAAGTHGEQVLAQLVNFLVGHAGHRRLVAKMLTDGPERLEDPSTAPKLSRARGAAAGATLSAPASAFVRLITGSISFTSMFAYLASISLWVAVAAALGDIPIALLYWRSNRQAYELNRDQARRPLGEHYWRSAVTRESIHELWGSGELLVAEKWESAFRADLQRLRHSLLIEARGRFKGEGIVAIQYAVMAVLIIHYTVPAHVPELVAGLQAVTMLSGVALSQAGNFARLGSSAWRLSESAEYLFASDDLGRRPPGVATTTKFHRLGADHLTYRYPSRPTPALSDVSVTLTRGQLVAIVGGNGSGKTTLARCLLGHFKPTAGAVRVDGEALRDPGTWARAAAYVPQRLSLLNLSVAQYLAMGRDVPKAHMIAALEMVGANWAADSLEVELGFEASAGTQISPGQRLQLAIARVLLRPEAQLVVLDEPSAGLAEWHVDKLITAIRTHFADRLVLMVSHREDLVNESDWVLWLDHGRLQGEGSPETCRRDEGFRRLWNSDAQGDG